MDEHNDLFFVYSTKDIIKQKEKNATLNNDFKQYKKELQVDQEMYQQELTLIAKNNPCSLDYLKRLQVTIGNINNDKLAQMLSHQFYNPSVMKNMQCIIQENFFTAPWGNAFSSEERARLHLRNIHTFGESSVNSIAYLANYNARSDIQVVIKEGRNTDADYSLIHEGFIGMYAINKLRPYCPNFMYTYALAKGGAFINKDYQTIAFLDQEHKEVYHLLVESIDNAIPMYQFLDTCTSTEFISTLLQVFYALEIAQDKIDFTHYDLHSANVLISTKSERTEQITYRRPDGSFRYIPATSIASIIDFGESHVKINNVNYGISRKKLIATDNKNKQLVDVYKLIGFLSYYYLYSKRNDTEINYIFATLWSIFSPAEDWRELTFKQRDIYYVYNKDSVNNTAGSLSFFIDQVETLLNVKWDKQWNTNMDNSFSCSTHTCYSDKEILQLEGLEKFKIPKDVMSLYDLYQYLVHQNDKKLADYLLEEYTTTKNFITSYRSLLQTTDNLLQIIKHEQTESSIPTFNANLLTDNNDAYNNTIFFHIEILHVLNDIRFNLHILQFYTSYITKKEVIKLNQYGEYYDDAVNYLKNYRIFFRALNNFMVVSGNKLTKESWLFINYGIIKDLLIL